MLRVYKPINDDIFKLQDYLEYLVCEIWCGKQTKKCEDYLDVNLRPLYLKYEWFRDDIQSIYAECKKLSVKNKRIIIKTFTDLKNISDVCGGFTVPLKVKQLPDIVEKMMKPFFIKCYESLLDRSLVPGDKHKYYNNLIKQNKIKFCPCCGYSSFESADSNYMEAYDHYLPKSIYPFASVNFLNLVPLCMHCNSYRKSTKDPIEGGRKAFYPFNINPDLHRVEVEVKFSHIIVKDFQNFEKNELEVDLIGDKEKCITWDDIFDIKSRYNDEVRSFTKALLRLMKKKFERESLKSYIQILDEEIDDFEDDKYSDRKFLKIAFLNEVKNCKDITDVYAIK
ncbi:hypothetical protein ACTJIV_19430 [Chryseobacterium sp. 22532]|uniref:hypothetical protein n=1 Tax=Chryseobacterium sp. 22532 TaxID=3453938 RepID=UPI003F86A96F